MIARASGGDPSPDRRPYVPGEPRGLCEAGTSYGRPVRSRDVVRVDDTAVRDLVYVPAPPSAVRLRGMLVEGVDGLNRVH